MDSKRVKIFQDSIRWDIFRQKRNRVVDEYMKVKKRQCRIRITWRMCSLNSVVRRAWKNFEIERDSRLRRERFQWATFLVAQRFKRAMWRQYGKLSPDSRNEMRCRTVLRLMGGVIYAQAYKNEAGGLLRDFLRATGWRYRAKTATFVTAKHLKFVFQRLVRQIRFKNMRLKLLKQSFFRELDNYQMHLSTSSKKKDQKLADKMASCDKRIVDQLLKSYLDRCLFVHSLAFFQHRLSTDPDKDVVAACALILNERRIWMIKNLKAVE